MSGPLARAAGLLLLGGCSAAAPAAPPPAPPVASIASAPLLASVAASAPPAPPVPARASTCPPERVVKLGERELCAEPSLLTWPEAEARCESSGGRLATLDSPEENAALALALASPVALANNLWIDLAQEDDGAWRWGDGTPLGAAAWAPGEPNNAGNNEHCGMVYAGLMLWNDGPCEENLGFVCAVAPAAQAPRGRGDFRAFLCSGRALKVDGAELCFHDEPRTWEAARVACTSSGGTLLSLPTRARQTAFAEAVWPRVHSSVLWLGYTDKDHEGDWRTTTGSAVHFSHWRDGEPNNYGGSEDCAEWNTSDGHWNDLACGEKRASLCEPARK